MKKVIVLIFMFLSFGFMFSQSRNTSLESNANRLIKLSLKDGNNIPERSEGSPYIKKHFSSTKINNWEVVYLVRYNAFSDLMEFQDKNSQIFFLDKTKDYVIKFNDGSDKIYHTVKYNNNERGYATFLWANSDNSLALYLKERIRFTDKKKAKSGYEQDIPAKFTRLKDSYFTKTTDGSLEELSTKKKNFFTVFKGKEKEVQQYIKKEKLKINKKENLIKIMSYYDSLIN